MPCGRALVRPIPSRGMVRLGGCPASSTQSFYVRIPCADPPGRGALARTTRAGRLSFCIRVCPPAILSPDDSLHLGPRLSKALSILTGLAQHTSRGKSAHPVPAGGGSLIKTLSHHRQTEAAIAHPGRTPGMSPALSQSLSEAVPDNQMRGRKKEAGRRPSWTCSTVTRLRMVGSRQGTHTGRPVLQDARGGDEPTSILGRIGPVSARGPGSAGCEARHRLGQPGFPASDA